MKKKKIHIQAVKGGHETGQIIITANKKVDFCQIELNELVNEDGAVFPRADIDVFYQKYLEVTRISDNETNGQLGWYPDMLLPYEKAKEYKENTIDKGNNQAVVLGFNIPFKQSQGVYKGTCNVDLDGERYVVEIELVVHDIVLPQIPTADSMFCMTYEFVARAERDESYEMRKNYVETLLKHKQVPRELPVRQYNEAGLCEAVREYYHRVPGYSIPMDKCEYWGAPRYMDYRYLEENLLAVAKIALADGVNYLDKVRNYFETVDEPDNPGYSTTYDAVSFTCKNFKETLYRVAEKIEAFDIPDHKLISKKLLAETVRNKIYGLVTTGYTEKIQGVDIWCSGFKEYVTEAARKTYKELKKPYWAYSCNAQTYPFPNYHIDDMNSNVSSRAIGWIMRQYGISGNLYYETVFFENVSYKGGLHLEPTNPYENPMKYPGTNGDGYLFYPGIKYGIKGPIISNRLLFIRESIDDYELLKILEELYRANNIDPSVNLKSLYGALHRNTEVRIDGQEFFKIRDKLLALIISAKSGDFTKVESK